MGNPVRTGFFCNPCICKNLQARPPDPGLMAVTDMAVTAMARGLLMLRPSPRLMPGTDMVASTATDSQPMAVMAMAVTATARGLLRLRLSHGTDMAVFTATDSQPMVPMVAMPMASKDLD